MIRSLTTRRLRRPVAALTCLLFLALPACYSYSPVEQGGEPDTGSEVRLRLNDGGADRVAEQTFLSERTIVEGRIVEQSGTQLRMLVSRPARRQFVAGGRTQDTVGVPRSGIESVELKQMETGKTAALFGGITAGAVLLGAAVLSSTGGGGSVDGGGGGTNPLSISIPISIP
ncbi:MAG: hypothetical protein Q8W44_00130 [Candidatus Palauibacterales bacterium]|nr:hypothetical protein [Candidatus Palauibacterales bacterium]